MFLVVPGVKLNIPYTTVREFPTASFWEHGGYTCPAGGPARAQERVADNPGGAEDSEDSSEEYLL